MPAATAPSPAAAFTRQKPPPRSEMIPFRGTGPEKESLEAEASRRGMSASDVIRESLALYFAQPASKRKPRRA